MVLYVPFAWIFCVKTMTLFNLHEVPVKKPAVIVVFGVDLSQESALKTSIAKPQRSKMFDRLILSAAQNITA